MNGRSLYDLGRGYCKACSRWYDRKTNADTELCPEGHKLRIRPRAYRRLNPPVFDSRPISALKGLGVISV